MDMHDTVLPKPQAWRNTAPEGGPRVPKPSLDKMCIGARTAWAPRGPVNARGFMRAPAVAGRT
eukprot:5013781-Pyramimonas_sp.AAC.1